MVLHRRAFVDTSIPNGAITICAASSQVCYFLARLEWISRHAPWTRTNRIVFLHFTFGVGPAEGSITTWVDATSVDASFLLRTLFVRSATHG